MTECNAGDPNNEIAKIDDIQWLVHEAEDALNRSELNANTIWCYVHYGLRVIRDIHDEAGAIHYSEKLIEEALKEKRQKYEQGLVSRTKYQDLRKAAFFLKSIRESGNLSMGRIPQWGLRNPSPYYSFILQQFCDMQDRTGALSETSIYKVKNAVRILLFELEDNGYTSFDDMSMRSMNQIFTRFLKRYSKSGISFALYSAKVFLGFLYESGITGIDLRLSMPRAVAHSYCVREGFSRDEVQNLLLSIDQNTSLGKRDYAIILLAAQTALRAVDIANLKRNDIDWRKREISIIQHKTGKPLSLPLPAESNNAIAEYILHHRPKSDQPYVFLCHTGTIRPIRSGSVSAIASRYMKRIGIASLKPGRAFHALRRYFATALMQEEVSVELIQQILGHSRINSAKPYLSADEQGLKNCALSLLSLDNTEGGI